MSVMLLLKTIGFNCFIHYFAKYKIYMCIKRK